MARSLRVLIRTASIWGATRHTLLVLLGYSLLFTLFFAPVLFSSYQLAPGDGLNYFLPSYYRRTLFWDGNIWGGFPAMADAPRMFWYPPALLLSLVPRSWDLFMVLAYVLAASFTYGYVYSLTRSRLGAAFSGVTYALCGFMIAHLGHAAIVHTVGWLPLIIWSLSELANTRGRLRSFWFTTAALAIACAALAGHPQMFVYVIVLSATCALAIGWRATAGRAQYYLACSLVMLLGIGLAAVQLVPTFELTRFSQRAQLNFADFVAFALPLRQLPMLVFPYLYGGAPDAFYGMPYFGAWPSSVDSWGATELTGYAGLLPLVLSAVALFAGLHRRIVWFWAVVALIAVLLAVGEATPLAHLTYQLPIVNKFRAPARHLFAFAFGMSVLAGIGVSAIQQQIASSRLVRGVIVCAAVSLALCLVLLNVFVNKLNELALQRLGHPVSLNPFTNPAVGVPLLIFLATSLAFFYWSLRPLSRWRGSLLLVLLVVDLSSFAWFYEWRYRSPSTSYLNAPAVANTYRAHLDATHERMLPIRGVNGRLSELPPNLSRLWRLPSASGHGPFILARTSNLLSMRPDGSVDDSWRNPANQALDLMAVRYLLVPPSEIEVPASTDERGVHWSASDFAVEIGPGCNPSNPQSFKMDLAQPVPATSIALVGALACSVEIPDEQEVLRLTLTDGEGGSVTQVLRAGKHFSEWAYDCADVRPFMRHSRAPVFRSYVTDRGASRCEAHDYLARLNLAQAEGGKAVKRIELHWTGAVRGTLALKKITLFDDESFTTRPVNPMAATLNDTSRWRYVGNIDASNSLYGSQIRTENVEMSRVYENMRLRPRVWLAQEVLTVSADEALTAVRTSRLPDGRPFDSARTALVEVALDFKVGAADESAHAKVVRVEDGLMEVRTTSRVPAFLVTSDVFYPGWSASVDGQPASLVRADYALRGVAVPAGEHTIRFEFRPRSFYQGAAISAGTLLLLAATVWLSSMRARRAR